MSNYRILCLGHKMTFNPAQLCLVICLIIIIKVTVGRRDIVLTIREKASSRGAVWYLLYLSSDSVLNNKVTFSQGLMRAMILQWCWTGQEGKAGITHRHTCSVLNPSPVLVTFFLNKIKNLYMDDNPNALFVVSLRRSVLASTPKQLCRSHA